MIASLRSAGLRRCVLALICCVAGSAGAQEKQVFFGDTHLHTSNSFDAYLNRNMSIDPATAYRFAKGLPVVHPFHKARVQLQTPLDFLVVADHAELMGVMRHIIERGIPTEDLGIVDRLSALYTEYWLEGVVEEDSGSTAFASFLPDASLTVEEAAAEVRPSPIPGAAAMSASVWEEATRTADEYNEPGSFTTLIGWEWSSVPAGANLHRVVFTTAGAEVASQFRPWSSLDSAYPEDLWTWLDEISARTGAEFIAIPHNSNISKGYMFTESTLRGEPYTAALAEKRLRWERVVEATQIKGDSETHPSLSPSDPFADFELYPHYIQNDAPDYEARPGDYVRSALKLGLSMEAKLGTNPYRFGLIGATDSHSGLASAEEPNFFGKFARDSTPENKNTVSRGGFTSGPNGWSMSASGLAAVWAPENTREAIMAAFRRREVYATTGPRMLVSVQAGWHGAELDVPMGGSLSASAGKTPSLRVHAQKDPLSANLDRLQVVKGWIDANGVTHERIYDVAASDGRVVGADGALPPVGNTVDVATGRYSNDIGAEELSVVWTDPDFDATNSTFYYVRVLEIPTPRHSVGDALALGLDPKEIRGAWFIQERAYTSPIWVGP